MLRSAAPTRAEVTRSMDEPALVRRRASCGAAPPDRGLHGEGDVGLHDDPRVERPEHGAQGDADDDETEALDSALVREEVDEERRDETADDGPTRDEEKAAAARQHDDEHPGV